MKVIIAGAGIAGAATAVALAQLGHECVMYDKIDIVGEAKKADGAPVHVQFGDVGGGLLIQVNGLRALERLGVLEELMAVSTSAPSLDVRKMDTSRPIKLSLKSNSKTIPCPILILRSNLHMVLMKRCGVLGVRTFVGKKIVSFEQDENQVTCQFLDGSSVTADLLVGADGIHSAIRRHLFGKHLVADLAGLSGYVGVTDEASLAAKNVNAGGLESPIAILTERLAKKEVIILKSGPGIVSFTVTSFSPPDPEATENWRPYANLPAKSEELAAAAEQWGLPNNLANYIRHAKRISPFTVYDLPNLPEFHKGRVVLVGDAAHGMPQSAGLGMSAGFEDVGVLYELFKRMHVNGNPSELQKALRIYDQVRVPRAHAVQAETRAALARTYSDSEFQSKLGHFVIRIVGWVFNITGNPMGNYDYLPELDKIAG